MPIIYFVYSLDSLIFNWDISLFEWFKEHNHRILTICKQGSVFYVGKEFRETKNTWYSEK